MSKSRPGPLGIRLTPAEKAALVERAAGRPLGSLIKEIILKDIGRPARLGGGIHDRMALARVLGLLGRSHLANNLNQIAKAANLGALPVTPELEIELRAACADVHAMRGQLLQALCIAAREMPGPVAAQFNCASGGAAR